MASKPNSLALLTVLSTMLCYFSFVHSNQMVQICASNHSSIEPTCNYTDLDSILGGLVNESRMILEVTVISPITLDHTIIFEDFQSYRIQSLTLIGSSETSIIKCIPKNGKKVNAGFFFYGITNLEFSNITFDSCSSELENHTIAEIYTSFKQSMEYQSALYILHCTDVSLRNVNVINSNGTGMSIFDVDGELIVDNSTFTENRLTSEREDLSSGGGVHVVLTQTQHSSFTFVNSIFMNNTAILGVAGAVRVTSLENKEQQGLGRGGGLCILIKDSVYNNSLNIINCEFVGNRAVWGGGLFVQVQDASKFNKITIEHSTFLENDCFVGNGGGANIGYVHFRTPVVSDTMQYNSIYFIDCLFQSNSAALFGGGISIFATRSLSSTNRFVFMNSSWMRNEALSGSAVDIVPAAWDILGNGALPVPIFSNCTFTWNKNRHSQIYLNDQIKVITYESGAFLITGFQVKFVGKTSFICNSDTALHLSSAQVDFAEGSFTEFIENRGKNGGAISLIAYSVLYIRDNSRFIFKNNSAHLKGGAIHSLSINRNEYFSSKSCFIQYRGTIMGNISQRNIIFVFKGNKVDSNNGNSIYSTTFQPCIKSCNKAVSKNGHSTTFQSCINYATESPILPENVFACLGTLSFPSGIGCDDFTTDVQRYQLSKNFTLSDIIPGYTYNLSIVALDEFLIEREIVYEAFVKPDNTSITPVSNHISNHSVLQFKGLREDSGMLYLENEQAVLSLEVSLSSQCNPGFFYDADQQTCLCAAFTFLGIKKCTATRAYITNGFWIGKCMGGTLCTTHCPPGFCHYNGSENITHMLPLNIHELDEFICGINRTGLLCGKCKGNTSAYYHSYYYACRSNALCNYGWFFYILSELVPLTILFLLIMIFDISFTSGNANGFILFVQVQDSLTVDAGRVIQFPTVVKWLTSAHRLIYRMFNFDFFSAESISFCLWRGATVMDVMAMKYVTIVYALGLLIVTVFVMNNWKCRRLCFCWRPRTIKNAIIHGLTAFSIMCYSQCARISFQILSHIFLHGENSTILQTVVVRSGHLTPFVGEHLRYAIPALFFLITVVAVPPILLILFPLMFKILSVFRLGETKFANILSRLIPIQLLDSFQSTFKDKFRFFAGLYFLYRLFALAAYAYSQNLSSFFTVVEVLLIIILAIHSTVQPYKKQWHNRLDSLIFANLAIINGITLFNYELTTESKFSNIHKIVAVTSSIQVLLVFVPLVYMICYCIALILPRIKRMCRKVCVHPNTEPSHLLNNKLSDSCDLPPLRDTRENNNFHTSYVQSSVFNSLNKNTY